MRREGDRYRSQCTSCRSLYRRGRYSRRNEDQIRSDHAKNAASYKKNRHQHSLKSKMFYLANSETVKARVKKYRAENKEKTSLAYLRWAKANPKKIQARIKRQRQARLIATPKWLNADQKAMHNWIYFLSKAFSKKKFKELVVDHIVPLNTVKISGLNVPWNIQVLSRGDNAKKSNHFDFTYENTSWRNT